MYPLTRTILFSLRYGDAPTPVRGLQQAYNTSPSTRTRLSLLFVIKVHTVFAACSPAANSSCDAFAAEDREIMSRSCRQIQHRSTSTRFEDMTSFMPHPSGAHDCKPIISLIAGLSRESK